MKLPPLNIERTATTPQVSFDPQSGNFIIGGTSTPENAAAFYQPVYDWLDAYALEPATDTTLTTYLDYFDTSSAKSLLTLFKKLEAIHKSGKSSVSITWYYKGNNGILEAGEEVKAFIQVPFHFELFKS